MLPRFFVPDVDPDAASVDLPADEAHHLVRALRLGAGAPVRVFDGRGREWEAHVLRAEGRGATVRLGPLVTSAPEPRIPLTLVVSVLKNDRMDDLVRDAVMMGVAALAPVVPARADVPLAVVRRSGRVARWDRIAVASAKQCGRAVVPVIQEPRAFADYLASPTRQGTMRLLMVEPAVSCGTRPARDLAAPPRAEIIIGPVGGWETDEVGGAIEQGAIAVRLGERTLRAERAPIVAIAALQTLWDDL